MTDSTVTKKFDMNLLAQALQVIQYVVVRDEIICLAAIVHADTDDDGSLNISMSNGLDLEFTPEFATDLTQILTRGLDQAKAMAARQAAHELGLVEVPGQMPRKPH
jgi:hypothetical protein